MSLTRQKVPKLCIHDLSMRRLVTFDAREKDDDRTMYVHQNAYIFVYRTEQLTQHSTESVLHLDRSEDDAPKTRIS